MRTRSLPLLTGALGLLLTTAWLVTRASTQAPAAALTAYIALFLPYLAILFALRPQSSSPPPDPSFIKKSLALVIGLAIASRIAFAMADPIFSDDIFRYVWDGRVAAAGINPYLHAPDSDALTHLRDTFTWPKINHKEIPTIYPPVAQMVFHLNALLDGGERSLRLLFILMEAACVAGLWRLLAKDKNRRLSVAVISLAAYLLNPLVLVEGIWSGHIDILAWSTLAIALVCFAPHRSLGSVSAAGFFLGMSIALKMISVIFLPLLLFAPGPADEPRARRAKRMLLTLSVPLLVVAASYAPYLSVGEKMFSGFGQYATRWRGNDGPFRAIMTASAVSMQALADPKNRADPDTPGSRVYFTLSPLEPLYLELGWTKQWQGKTVAANTYADDQLSQTIAKLIVAGLMGLMLLWCLLVVRDPLKGSLLLLGTLFFLAPTLYPWYVAWLVPLAVLTRTRTPILFGMLSLASYAAWISHHNGGPWEVPTWLVTLEFGAVFFAAFYEITARSKDAAPLGQVHVGDARVPRKE